MAEEEVMADGNSPLLTLDPDDDDGQVDMTGDGSPRAVGHNIYILAHQLAKHNQELAQALRPDQSLSGSEALQFYKKHTAQIEVGRRLLLSLDCVSYSLVQCSFLTC